MQNTETIVRMITKDRPDLEHSTIFNWACYLEQLEDCELVSACNQNTDPARWLQNRVSGIGGSDIACLAGRSPWNSPRDIWMSKTKQFAAENKPQSEQARWGNVLEDVIADEWAKRNNKQIVKIPVLLCNKHNRIQLANIDGFILSDDRRTIESLLEIKTTSAYNQAVWEFGPLPEYYMWQANWYTGITCLPEYTIVCLVGGQRLFDYTLPFNKAVYAEEVSEGNKFWNENVLKMVEPAATSADAKLIKEFDAPDDIVPVIREEEGIERLADSYIQLREKIKTLEKVKQAIYADLFINMGGATQVLTQTHMLSLRSSNRRNCDYDKLAADFPDAYDSCINYTKSNSLNIK